MARRNESESKLVITGEDRSRAAFKSALNNVNQLDAAALGLRGSFASLSGIGASGGLLGVVTAVGAGAAILAKNAADIQDEFYKMSQRVGVSTEVLSGWAYAARLADVSQDQLGTGLKQLSKNLIAGDEAFAALHITGKTTEEVFLQVADRFAEMEDGAGKTALAMRIFGKAGADLIPLLNEGSAGLAKFMEEARKMGLIVGTESAKAAEEFNDKLTKMGARVDGLKMRIGNELIPTFDGFITRLENASGPVDAFNLAVRMLPASATTVWLADYITKLDEVKTLTNDIAELEARRAQVAKSSSPVFRDRAQADIDRKIAEKRALIGSQYEYIDDSTVIPGFKIPKKAAPHISSDSERTAASKKAAEERIFIAKNLQEQEEEFAKDYAEAWKFTVEYLNGLKDEAAKKDIDRNQVLMDLYDREQEERIQADEERQGIDADNKKEALADQTDLVRELGLTFNSAIEDAIVNFDTLGDVAGAFGKDLARLAIREYVTKPLLEAALAMMNLKSGGGGGGSGLGGLFSGLVSAAFTAIGGGGGGGGSIMEVPDGSSFVEGIDIPGMATGTNYVPQDMLAMLHKGEKVVPAKYNQGSEGSRVSVVNHNDFRGADPGSEARILRAQEQQKREIIATVQDMARRGQLVLQ